MGFLCFRCIFISDLSDIQVRSMMLLVLSVHLCRFFLTFLLGFSGFAMLDLSPGSFAGGFIFLCVLL